MAIMITPIFTMVESRGKALVSKVGKFNFKNLLSSPIVKTIMVIAVAALLLGLLTYVIGFGDWEKAEKKKVPDQK
jgi:hypothetical protein